MRPAAWLLLLAPALVLAQTTPAVFSNTSWTVCAASGGVVTSTAPGGDIYDVTAGGTVVVHLFQTGAAGTTQACTAASGDYCVSGYPNASFCQAMPAPSGSTTTTDPDISGNVPAILIALGCMISFGLGFLGGKAR